MISSATAKLKPVAVPLHVIERRVEPGEEPNSGCYFCPLLCMSKDFEERGFNEHYQRDADKILAKLKEPHTVKTRKVEQPQPWGEVDVLFVEEAPGGDEDNKGEPFAGRNGKFIREILAETFDTVSTTYAFTSVIRCRTPLNRDPSKMEVQCCTPELTCEVRARKPKVIVPLGNHSLNFFAGRTGITTAAGYVMRCVVPEFEHIKIVPNLHPAYVLRFDENRDKFIASMKEAMNVALGNYEERAAEGTVIVLDQMQDVLDLLKAIREDGLLTAYDTETGGSTPFQDKFPKMLCYSLSNEEGWSYVIPWDHVDSPWSLDVPEPTYDSLPENALGDEPPRKGTRARGDWEVRNGTAKQKMLKERIAEWKKRIVRAKKERPIIRAALAEFFATPQDVLPKVAQNEKFDVQHIKESTGAWVAEGVLDSMLIHLTQDDRRGTHGLGTLAYQHTGMGGYHKVLDDYVKAHPECAPDKGGSYANIPGEVLFIYAGHDADATRRSVVVMREDPEYAANEQARILGETFLPKVGRTFAHMEYNGATIDQAVLRNMQRDLTAEREEVAEEITKLPQVRQFVADQIAKGRHGKRKADQFEFNPGSDAQIRNILFGYYGCRPLEMTDKGWDIFKARKTRREKDFAPGTDVWGEIIDAAIEAGEWEFFSVKEDVLHEYERQGIDVASAIVRYRKTSKLLGTYVEPMFDRLDKDSRVHGNFWLTSTTTGRSASSNPNLQNQPPYAKRAFISRFGVDGILLGADYSQIELRVAACLFNEPRMIQAYLDAEDLHKLTAIAISGLTAAQYGALSKEDQKRWRVRAKRINFGIIYGVGPPGIVNTLRKDGVHISIEEATELRDRFRKAYPDLIAAMEALMEEVRATGQLQSFTGRVRRLPEVGNSDNEIVGRALRQAVNFPVQGGASDITLMALVLIDDWLRENEMQSKLILTVHDQIVVDAHVNEAMAIAVAMKDIMENVPKYSEGVLPGLDWSWLQVPLVAEFDSGVNWYHTVEWDPDVVAAGDDSEPLKLYEYDEKGKWNQYAKPRSVDELWDLMTVRATKEAA